MDRASYRRRHAPSGMMPASHNLPVERGQPRRAGRHLVRRGSVARRIVGITVRIIGVVAGVSVRVAARNLDVATVVLVVRTAVRRLRRFGALAVAVLGRQSPNQHADQANQRANATTIERFVSSFMDTTLGAARPTHKRPSDDDPVETILRLRISRRDERWRPAQACNRRIPFP